ncbi:MAG: hypothetical protein ACI9J2_002350 [Saprospiraceae bacterium]|jgi:hypothetical protein
MPKYSLEKKEAVLSKLLSPNNQSFAEIWLALFSRLQRING